MTLERYGPAHSEEWFEARRGRVTASNSCHLMIPDLRWGKTPEELAHAIAFPTPYPPRAMMAAGTHFEDANLAWFGFLTGLDVIGDGDLWVRTDIPFMGASPDGRAIVGERETLGFDPPIVIHDAWGRMHEGEEAVELVRAIEGPINIEAKQSRSKDRSKWRKEQPPAYYENQTQHQMHVLEMDTTILFAKVDAFEVWGYIIERNEGYGGFLETACKEFQEKYLLPLTLSQ